MWKFDRKNVNNYDEDHPYSIVFYWTDDTSYGHLIEDPTKMHTRNFVINFGSYYTYCVQIDIEATCIKSPS